VQFIPQHIVFRLICCVMFCYEIYFCDIRHWPPLWSSGQCFWLQIQRSRVQFLALPDFLRSRGSGTGSTQPCEDNWGVTWMKKYWLRSRKPEINGRGNLLLWPHNTLYPRKLALTSLTSSSCSVGIVRLQIKAMEFSCGHYWPIVPAPDDRWWWLWRNW
jgi:hypothetical protein